MILDPICCLTVDESTERRVFFDGETVYFCSERCRGIFLSKPDAEKSRMMRQEPAVHICAKHPEVWQEDPCDCPQCRMALKPAAKSAETNGREESAAHDMTARFGSAAALVLAMLRGWRAITTGRIQPPARYILKSRAVLRTTVPSA